MNHEVYYLPVNFTDAGRVFGLFEIRNLVEAVLLTLPLLYFCMVLLPLSRRSSSQPWYWWSPWAALPASGSGMTA